jgi:two-component system, OmpR family, sensor kinase
MKLGSLPTLAVPRLGLASFRRRILFRSAFLLLTLATLALALALLTEERQRSFENYRLSITKTHAEIVAKLRHPSGQLALLNPDGARTVGGSLHPLLLPFAAIDFDDLYKAQQAVELSSCAVQYADGASICIAIGNNPYAGGFIYIVGSYLDGALVSRERGAMDFERFHRARVTLNMRGQVTRWIAPFEDQTEAGALNVRGRLTGFADIGAPLPIDAKPIKDFRAWVWQSGQCADNTSEAADCAKRTSFSLRLPVEIFRDALFQKPRPVWPPGDLDQIGVQFEMLGPNDEKALFDSDQGNASPPLSIQDLKLSLLPGEVLAIDKSGSNARRLLTVKGAANMQEVTSPLLEKLIRKLPLNINSKDLTATETIRTPIGNYDVKLNGDVRSLDQRIAAVATRMSWFVGAMLGVIALAWLVIEIGLIRPIGILTKRAAAVSFNVQEQHPARNIGELEVSDLRGKDELGILAGGLADLLQRVKDDVQREQIRLQQEQDMWHAVGHEIMSPLQSLMVLHADAGDQSHRYVQRMQQAVRILYGTASPSEALEASTLKLGAVDLNAFLTTVAHNAHFAGIDHVVFTPSSSNVMTRADEFSLEDVVTHILRNADRFRIAGTPIQISLTTDENSAQITIHNQGPSIDSARIGSIFEYGVTESAAADATNQHRGQGLFVVKTYMAKMGGTVEAKNTENGVSFLLRLLRVG